MATQLKPADTSAYDNDVVGWAQSQTAALLARRADLIDWENVAEEIADVGKSQESALESAVRLVLLLLLKWDHQPKRRSRSWVISIAEQRAQALRRLRINPSLRPELPDLVGHAYASARRGAAIQMKTSTRIFPAECPYDWDTLMTPHIEWDGEQG